MSDLTYKIKQSQTEPLRTGVMTSFNNLAELKAGFKGVLANFSSFNAEEVSHPIPPFSSPRIIGAD
jgi:acetyl-CoA carboxylase/biotin carboxylase 1